MIKKQSSGSGSIISHIKTLLQDKKNKQILPGLEKAVKLKQRSNVVDELIDKGSVKGSTTGRLKYKKSKPKEDTSSYMGYNEVGEYVRMKGKKPTKLK